MTHLTKHMMKSRNSSHYITKCLMISKIVMKLAIITLSWKINRIRNKINSSNS